MAQLQRARCFIESFWNNSITLLLSIDFFPSPDDALKSMDCENNLSMFKAISNLQVNFL